MKRTTTFLKGVVVFCSLAGLHASAQSITVTNTNDSGAGSFRQAVMDSEPGGTIIFNPSTNGTAITLSSAITIDKNLTISGNGIASTSFDGNETSRIFTIMNATGVSISDITFTDGYAADNGGAIMATNSGVVITNAAFTDNEANGSTAAQGGGAIYTTGTLSVTGSSFTDNDATGAAGSGGAILVGTGGNLTITASTLTDNTSNRAGGAIEGNSGADTSITINNVTFTNNTTNTSPGNGGAIHITGAGNTSVTGSVFTGNTAGAEGGALWNGSGTMTISSTTITNNTAAGAGADQGGGGIYNLSGIVNINPDTVITDNDATGAAGSGGGILNDVGGRLTITGATISANTSNRAGGGIEDNSGATGFVTISNTTLDNNITNTSPGNGGGLHVTGAGTVMVTNGTVSGNQAGAEGGGLWNGSGAMTIMGTVINNNTASGIEATNGGGGIYNLSGSVTINTGTQITNNTANGTAGSGGGILNDVGGMLTINNAVITGNTSNRAGGGIEDNSGAMGSVMLTSVTLNDNTTNNAPGNGGGLHVTGSGTVAITGGTVNGNDAGAEGGGLWNGTGTMNIDGTIINGNTASGNDATNGGGGIYNLNAGTVTIINATISNNVANGTAGSGGGILNDVGSMLTITNTEISGNTAVRAGGGIEDNSETSTIVLNNVDLTGNSVSGPPGNGGGLHITGGGSATITGGSVTGNSAVQGGGLWNAVGTLTVNGATIDGNTATGAGMSDGGGGIYNNGGTLAVSNSTISANNATGLFGRGGGIHVNGGTATILVTTISGNGSITNGGGIYNNGTLTVNANTIALNNAIISGGGIYNNTEGGASLKNTIVAGNTAVLSGRDVFSDVGSITSNGFNLIGVADGDDFTALDSDITGTALNPAITGLMPLADNGGATLTHALTCPNVAADMGSTDDAFADQIGMAVFNGRRDIGAYEAQEECAVAGTAEFNLAVKSRLFPNPSVNGLVTIQLAENHNAIANVYIYEIATGKLVKTLRTNGTSTQISVDNLARGTYAVRITSDRASETHKLIVGL